MKKIKAVLLLLILINFVGCKLDTLKPPPINITVPELNFQEPEPLKLKKIKWIIITNENYEQIVSSSIDKQGLVLLIAIDEKGYKDLASNNAKILKYIREQKTGLTSYKKYYETTN